MANHVQRFTASGTAPTVFRCYRAGYNSENVALNPQMTIAQIKAAFEALAMFTTVTPSSALAGNGSNCDVTFNDPGDERLFFEVAEQGDISTIEQVRGQSSAEAMGVPLVDQFTYYNARFTAPINGKPAGVNSANLRMRSKNPGDLDSAYSAWTTAIAGVPWTGTAVFNVPAFKILEFDFETL